MEKTVASTVLKYVDCKQKGYKRLKRGKKFRYKNLRGEFIKDERTIRRINALVIPPAWQRVWICPDPKGHIQCYGFDLRNRKQYIYHKDWSAQQGVKKFNSLTGLGNALSTLKRRVGKDLNMEGWSKEKACALALAVIQKTLMRIGNARYTKENKSYGLTTLKKNHFSLADSIVSIQYVGKKGVEQLHTIKNPKIYKLIQELNELPGRNMFKFYESEGAKKLTKLKPKDVNRYLQTICGDNTVTVKSFRVWGASVMAIREMAGMQRVYCDENCQKQLNEIIDKVALVLGNTRDVARKYYIHPTLQELFLRDKFYQKLKLDNKKSSVSVSQSEKILLKILG